MGETALIVGGGLAGVRTAQALRDNGFEGRIAVVSAEDEPPYDRPPLSKSFLLGAADDDAIRLVPADAYETAGIQLELSAAARALHADEQTVELDDGRRLHYDKLVIATGARPRRLGGRDDLPGVHYLRSAADARALRLALGERPRLAVVGGGFIGLEVAAVAATLGADVTVVEALVEPLAGVVGLELGKVIRALHEQHGVSFRCGTSVRGLAGDGGVEAVEINDGARVSADVVVVGIGIQPNVEWVADSGVALHRGVVTDAEGRTSLPDVWAVGDASCRHVAGTCIRSEHWTAAGDHAQRAARAIVGGARTEDPVETYFWSDQYDARFQFVGTPAPGLTPALESGAPDARKFVVAYRDGERTAAIFAMNSPREFLVARSALRRELAAA